MPFDVMTAAAPPRAGRFARTVGRHAEHHRSDRIGWLRAVVLGAVGRVLFWGAIAMAVTAGAGALFGTGT